MSNVTFEHIPLVENQEPLVNLSNYPFIVVPVYYHNNWTTDPNLYLRKNLADKLLAIQHKVLTPKHLQWVIYDGWRSRETQAKIYEYYWKKFSFEQPHLSLTELKAIVGTYVTIPQILTRIPPHSTGGAVDLGLWDTRSQSLVNLGAQFDEFIAEVKTDFFEKEGQSFQIRDLRRFLNEILFQSNISSDIDEYFHKDFGNQKWAATLKKPFAVYGEIVSAQTVGTKVSCVFAHSKNSSWLHSRVEALAANLDLTHPTLCPVPALPNPEKLVVKYACLPFSPNTAFECLSQSA